LQIFRREVSGLAKGNIIPSGIAAQLKVGVTTAENAIRTLAVSFSTPVPDPKDYCQGFGPCQITPCSAFTTYHVDIVSRAFGGGDGSPGRPFRFINDALARAAALGLCGADVMVAGGAYPENIVVSRHTRIHGDAGQRVIIVGSVSNTGPHELQIAHVTISPFAGMGVFVDHPCAVTLLSDVRVEGASGYGIRQKGGALTVTGASVLRTRAEPDYITRGTGIYLSCGVHASLLGVTLDRNHSAGLLLDGSGTEVGASLLFVTHTEVNPYYGPGTGTHGGLGAVWAQNGAELRMEFCFLDDNQFYGLSVRSGAHVDFRDGGISRTRAVEGWENATGGFNVAVESGGMMEMTNFISTRADLVGVLISGEGSEMDLHDGEVSFNAIGANVQVQGYDLDRLQDNVVYKDNGRNLDGAILPLPEPIEHLDLP